MCRYIFHMVAVCLFHHAPYPVYELCYVHYLNRDVGFLADYQDDRDLDGVPVRPALVFYL